MATTLFRTASVAHLAAQRANGSPWLFPADKGDGHVTDPRALIQKLLGMAKIDKHVTPRVFRHTFGGRRSAACAPLRTRLKQCPERSTLRPGRAGNRTQPASNAEQAGCRKWVLGCVKTHTSPKCGKYNSPTRHRSVCAQYDLTPRRAITLRFFYVRGERWSFNTAKVISGNRGPFQRAGNWDSFGVTGGATMNLLRQLLHLAAEAALLRAVSRTGRDRLISRRTRCQNVCSLPYGASPCV
jgi:hypothetical protein